MSICLYVCPCLCLCICACMCLCVCVLYAYSLHQALFSRSLSENIHLYFFILIYILVNSLWCKIHKHLFDISHMWVKSYYACWLCSVCLSFFFHFPWIRSCRSENRFTGLKLLANCIFQCVSFNFMKKKRCIFLWNKYIYTNKKYARNKITIENVLNKHGIAYRKYIWGRF